MSEVTDGIDPGAAEPVTDEVIEESSPPAETAAEAPKAKGVQKRLDELTRLRYDAERDRDHWREMAMQRQPEPPAPEIPKGKPTVDQFASYEEFTEAVADYKVTQILTQREEETQRQRAQYEAMTQREAFDARTRAFEAEAPDFRAVAYNPSLPVSDAMAQAIQSSDMGPALLYHLGKSPELAAQIAAMSPYQAAMRLGRLEAQLSAPQAKRNSGAPPPIDPLGGGHEGVSADIYNERLTDEQYFALRAKQRNQRK